MSELKSYADWKKDHRQVVKGEKCKAFQDGVALFSVEQTSKILPDLMRSLGSSGRAYSDPWEGCGLDGGYDPIA